jgi:hypothetical protein
MVCVVVGIKLQETCVRDFLVRPWQKYVYLLETVAFVYTGVNLDVCPSHCLHMCRPTPALSE